MDAAVLFVWRPYRLRGNDGRGERAGVDVVYSDVFFAVFPTHQSEAGVKSVNAHTRTHTVSHFSL